MLLHGMAACLPQGPKWVQFRKFMFKFKSPFLTGLSHFNNSKRVTAPIVVAVEPFSCVKFLMVFRTEIFPFRRMSLKFMSFKSLFVSNFEITLVTFHHIMFVRVIIFININISYFIINKNFCLGRIKESLFLIRQYQLVSGIRGDGSQMLEKNFTWKFTLKWGRPVNFQYSAYFWWFILSHAQ